MNMQLSDIAKSIARIGMARPRVHAVLSLSLMLVLAGCLSVSRQPTVRSDGPPTYRLAAHTITDATPRQDRVTRAGNKNPYTVMGKTYHLLPTSKGYKEQGFASWYGTKFQGRPTANGEKYNLYGMSAAHRTLPIPAYVKVTNLENGRTAIVRVNDRGPFHEDRIIDLSYAAAVKLGYAEKGVARVEVEVIDVSERMRDQTASLNDDVYFLQVGAFKSLELASKLRSQLLLSLKQDVLIKNSEPPGYYQVRVGPMAQLNEVQQVSEQLATMGMGQAHLVRP